MCNYATELDNFDLNLKYIFYNVINYFWYIKKISLIEVLLSTLNRNSLSYSAYLHFQISKKYDIAVLYTSLINSLS